MTTNVSPETIINWVNSFSGLTYTCSSISDLSNGVTFYEIVAELLPENIDKKFCKYEGVNDNWILKRTNLEKVKKVIEDFYETTQNYSPFDAFEVNTKDIAQNDNEEDIITFTQIIIGILLKLDNQKEYIEKIMDLPEQTQLDLKEILEDFLELAPKDDSTFDSIDVTQYDEELVELQGTVDRLTEENKNFMRVCEKMKSMNQELTIDKNNLQSTLEQLKSDTVLYQKQIRELEEIIEDKKKDANNESVKTILENNKALQQLQTSRDIENQELKFKLDEMVEEIKIYKKKMEELIVSRNENKNLKEEIEILKEDLISSEEDKKRISQLRDKLSKYQEINQQLELSEKSVDQFRKKCDELNSKLKQFETVNNQVIQYKLENSEKETQIAEFINQLELLNSKYNKSVDMVNSLEDENNELLEKVGELENSYKLLQESKEFEELSKQNISIDNTFVELTEAISTPNQNESLEILQTENDTLKEKIENLQKRLESTEANNTNLVDKLQQANQKIQELITEKIQLEKKNEDMNDMIKEKERELLSPSKYDSNQKDNSKLQEQFSLLNSEIQDLKAINQKQNEKLFLTEQTNTVLQQQLEMKTELYKDEIVKIEEEKSKILKKNQELLNYCNTLKEKYDNIPSNSNSNNNNNNNSNTSQNNDNPDLQQKLNDTQKQLNILKNKYNSEIYAKQQLENELQLLTGSLFAISKENNNALYQQYTSTDKKVFNKPLSFLGLKRLQDGLFS
eukprot:TRINITY_DN1609_c2_g1_i2.p1 TRINITY_DN1609_c2_g1~~TRINITY_DN1609_c2_g1_i2.p1  ORF type:complete len:740 (+),score=227.66 TRINITY_DN1609_c2_g1_i2:50-2269(+)